MEAATVTGPAKNLIGFCSRASKPQNRIEGLPVIDPQVLTFVRGRSQKPNAFLSALEAASIPAIPIPEKSRFDTSVLAAIRAALYAHKSDLVQTHNVKSHFLFRLSGLHRTYPWIAFHHGYTATDPKMRLYNQLDWWSLRAARLVVTVCTPFAEELIRKGVSRSRIRVLHNSVTVPALPAAESVEKLRRKLGITAERVILTVGRFSREKGLDYLLDEFATLRTLKPLMPVRLVLVGDGPEREKLNLRADELELKDSVIFTGHVTDVPLYYAMADVLALPSRSEGSPNVVLEAMATGLPIAATAVGGVPELLEDEVTALLVRSGQPAALAHAIHRLLIDESLALDLSRRARAKIESSFQPDDYRRALLAIYGEALSG